MMRPTLAALSFVALGLAQPSLAADGPDEVTMGLSDFLRMYDKTKDPKKPPAVSPREYSLSRASYLGEVVFEDDAPVSALFTATIRIDVHKKDGWVRVPLLSGQVALRGATIDGRAAPVVLEGGDYTLVTDRQGAFDVKLDFAVSVGTGSGTTSLTFPLARSGAIDLTLTVPVDDALDFVVAGARYQSDKVVSGKRVLRASLPPSGSMSVRWQREIPEAEQEEPRVYSEVYTLVGLGDGVVRAQTTVTSSILFAGVDTFQYRVPSGMTLLDVKGAGMRDWSVDEQGVLTVVLNYAAETRYALSMEMERVVGQGDQQVDAPLIEPLGVERSKGWVGVEARGNLEIGAGEVANATAVDVRTLPAHILGITSQPVLLGYKYLGADADIPLVVSQHADVEVLVTLLDQANATTMFTNDGRRLTSVVYEVRNNRRQFLRLELPDGAELWSASVAGRPVQPATSGDAILLPLVRSASSGGSLASFGVEVVYVESGEGPADNGRGSFRAELPGVDVPTTYVAWTVYAPSEARVKAKSREGSLRSVDYLSRPLGAVSVLTVSAEAPAQQRAAQNQANAGALGDGAAPVKVRLPLQGTAYHFEKLLALDESLWVSFTYSGLKD